MIKTKKWTLLIALLIGSFSQINAQKIDWSMIQIDSISKIDETNDSLINSNKYPDLTRNGLVLNVASTEYYDEGCGVIKNIAIIGNALKPS